MMVKGTKKVLSLLLAVMLIIGAVPLTASAASEEVTVKLTAATSLGRIPNFVWNSEDEEYVKADDYSTNKLKAVAKDTAASEISDLYNLLGGNKVADLYVTNIDAIDDQAEAYETIESNAEIANQLYTGTAGSVTVTQGSTFWIGMKIDDTNMPAGQTYGGAVYYEYNPDGLTFPDDADKVIINKIITSGAVDKANATAKKFNKVVGEKTRHAVDYYSGYTTTDVIFDGSYKNNEKTYFALGISRDDTGFALARGAEWDVIIPVTAKATGTWTITPTLQTLGSMAGSITYFKSGTNGSYSNTDATAYQQSNSNIDKVALSTLTINVVAAPVAPVKPTVTGAAYASGVPTFTFDSTGAQVANLKYQIDGTDTWTALNAAATDGTIDAGNNTWTVGSTVLDALIAGKTIKVSADEGAAGTYDTTIAVAGADFTVTREATGTASTALTYDYATMKVTPASGYEVWDATGEAWATTAVDFTYGGKVKFRTAGATNGIASASAEDTAASVGELTVNPSGTTRDHKLNQKTTVAVSGVASGTLVKYVVKASNVAAPSAEADYNGGNETVGSEAGYDITVAAKEGEKIYLYVPGTAGSTGVSGTPAKKASTDGLGFTAPAIIQAAPADVNDPVVLTFKDEKGEFVSGATATVTQNGSTVTPASVTVDNSETNNSVKLSIAAPSGGWVKDTEYTVTVATAATRPNMSAAYTGTFTISDNGYNVKIAESGNKHDSTESTTATFTGSTVQPGATAEYTITGLKDYETFDKDSFTVTGGGSVTAVNVATSKFTYKAPGNVGDAKNDKTPVTITINTKKNVKTLDAANLTVTNATKTYDGTDTATVMASTTGLHANGKNTATIEWAGATYAESSTGAKDGADVGSIKTITLTGVAVTGADKDYYTVANTLEVSGTIAQATATTIKATVPSGNIPASADKDTAISAILNNSTITVDAIEASQGRLGDFLVDTYIETILKGITAPAEPVYTAAQAAVTPTVNDTTDTAAISTAVTTLVVGDTYTFAPGTTVTFEDSAGNSVTAGELGITVNEGDGRTEDVTVVIGETKIPDGTKIKAGSQTITIGNGADVTPAAAHDAIPEKWDFSAYAGKDLTFNVNLPSTVNDANGSTLAKNFTAASIQNAKVAVSAAVNARPSGGGYYGPTATLNTKGYGSVTSTTVELDADGKIISLPDVTDVVKGALFVGWSTDGTKAHIIDPETFVADGDIELFAVYDGYMVGDEKGKANADKKVTKAELARMLVVANGEYDPTVDYGKSSFSDAQSGWFVDEIALAEKLGILSGDGNKANTVRPNDNVTREEAAIMIARAFGVTVEEDGTTEKITDFDQVSSWAKKFVAVMCNNGTINGYEDGTFRANRNITRAEIAQMINIYLGLTEEAKDEIEADETIVSPFPDVKTKNWQYANLMFASLSVPASYYSTEITVPAAK